MYFPASGVECSLWIPPTVAFVLAFLTAPAGVSGAFLLLPFQMSVLGFVGPAVTPTNLIYNMVALPGGVYRYAKERRMAWPVAWAIVAGSLPGVFLGAVIRVRYLPDPWAFKIFIGLVLLFVGTRLVRDTWRQRSQPPLTGGGALKTTFASARRVEYEFGGRKFSFSPIALAALALVVGVIGGIYGVGGGAFIAPYIIGILGLPAYTIAGAAMLGTFLTSIAGIASFAALGHAPDWQLGLTFGAGGLFGSYFGARMQKHLPERWIRLLLGIVVLATAATILRAANDRIPALRKQVAAREAAGGNALCSYQILSEASWLASYVKDPARLEKRLNDLDRVLAHPEQEARAGQQDPADGSWGQCHDEWFFKVNATFDHLTKPSNATEIPRYKLQLFDRVNSPEKLQEYFANLAVSDLPRTAIDHRKELNESLSNLMRLILRDRPAYYAWHPRLKDTLMDLILNRLRNPRTGWWGESYVRNGRLEFVDDLSVTFHVISYLPADVPDMPLVVDHLLAVKNLEYPIGWLEHGRSLNHHNMDVVTLFRRGWPYLNAAQKQAVAAEIHKMLDWCLRETLQPDGSFKPDLGSSDSLEENHAWGVSFLSRIGFFDPAKRFWTDEKFPQAERIRQKLIAYIEKHNATGGAGGTYYESSLNELK